MSKKSTTTTETRLMACPVCRLDIVATLSFDIRFEQVRAEGDDRILDPSSFVASPKPTGVSISHDCIPVSVKANPNPFKGMVTINDATLR
jgi:hypothetical protein